MGSQAPAHKAPTAQHPSAGDGAGRLFRWAMGSVVVGLLVIYNSVEADPKASEPFLSPPPATHAVPFAIPQQPQPRTTRSGSGPGMPRSRPTRLQIPTIGVDAPFTELSMNASGVMNPPPPDNNNLVGWYRESVTPGEYGNSVVAGHVDTKSGPAVFLLLSALAKGSTADITRADGSVATFTVDSVESFSKDKFPDKRVYGDTTNAQLRLITCGGTYDHRRKDYTDNVVVFAHLTSSTDEQPNAR